MKNKEIFKIWYNSNCKWSKWIKPILYLYMTERDILNNSITIDNVDIDYVNNIQNNSAIIVDLPSDLSVKEGIALAKNGFVPIPIYNGVYEQENSIATIDQNRLKYSLIKGSFSLKELSFSNNNYPAFLLDSLRMNRYKMNNGVFDNSYDIYPQDLPSAEYFLSNNISKVYIKTYILQDDLKKILFSFNKKGIDIYVIDEHNNIKNIKQHYLKKIHKYNKFEGD